MGSPPVPNNLYGLRGRKATLKNCACSIRISRDLLGTYAYLSGCYLPTFTASGFRGTYWKQEHVSIIIYNTGYLICVRCASKISFSRNSFIERLHRHSYAAWRLTFGSRPELMTPEKMVSLDVQRERECVCVCVCVFPLYLSPRCQVRVFLGSLKRPLSAIIVSCSASTLRTVTRTWQ